MTSKFKAIKPKAKAPRPAAKRPQGEEAADRIIDAARDGVEMVIKRVQAESESVSIGLIQQMTLGDITNQALSAEMGGVMGLAANCRFCVMAAWQLGRQRSQLHYLPGTAVAHLIKTIKEIPGEDRERHVAMAASLAASVISETMDAGLKNDSVRMHLLAAFLFGHDRAVMDRGLS